MEERGDMHYTSAQRAVLNHGPRLSPEGRHDTRHRQFGGAGLDVSEHPGLDTDHPRVDSQVRELHHIPAAAAGLEHEVVVSFPG